VKGQPVNLPSRRLLGTIQDCRIWEEPNGRVHFVADADIDCDGGSNPFHDPFWQPDTSLRLNGRSIDAETVPFVVVPPLVVLKVQPVVLGCRALVTNLDTNESVECVVADLGPTFKVGEISPAAAKRISVDPNPNTGGEGSLIIEYSIWPGVAANVLGVQYRLQSYYSRG
jgi:hypothetical protein